MEKQNLIREINLYICKGLQTQKTSLKKLFCYIIEIKLSIYRKLFIENE